MALLLINMSGSKLFSNFEPAEVDLGEALADVVEQGQVEAVGRRRRHELDGGHLQRTKMLLFLSPKPRLPDFS
jgi:hypothetical protein